MIRTIIAVVAILAVTYGLHAYRASRGAEPKLVPTVSTDQVLALIREGKKVVFVDAREGSEWREEHIPGAINVPLREIGTLDRSTLGDPDLVVAYCLKDFRGFEVAKALREANVGSASILAELGINGWKKKGLPTVIAGGQSELQASARLSACARDEAQCSGQSL